MRVLILSLSIILWMRQALCSDYSDREKPMDVWINFEGGIRTLTLQTLDYHEEEQVGKVVNRVLKELRADSLMTDPTKEIMVQIYDLANRDQQDAARVLPYDFPVQALGKMNHQDDRHGVEVLLSVCDRHLRISMTGKDHPEVVHKAKGSVPSWWTVGNAIKFLMERGASVQQIEFAGFTITLEEDNRTLRPTMKLNDPSISERIRLKVTPTEFTPLHRSPLLPFAVGATVAIAAFAYLRSGSN